MQITININIIRDTLFDHIYTHQLCRIQLTYYLVSHNPTHTLSMRLKLLLLLFFINTSLYSINPTIKNLTTEHGLASNIVRWTFQDEKGFIWISTKSGLTRYDGYECRNYEPSDSIHGYLQGSLLSPPINLKENDLLFTSGKGLVSYSSKQDKFHYYKTENQTFYNTKHLIKGTNNDFWVAKDNVGFIQLRIEKDSTRVIRIVDGSTKGFSTKKTHLTYKTSNGEVWLFASDYIAVVQNNNIRYAKNWGVGYFSMHEYKENGRTHYILIDSAGYFYSLNPTTLEVTPYSHQFLNSRDIRHSFKCKFIDPNTLIGISRKEGIFLLSHNFKEKKVTLEKHIVKQPSTKHSLSSNNIRHIAIDNLKRVWLSTDGGGVCYFNLNPNQFSHIKYTGETGGLSDGYISSIYEDRFQNLWVSVWQSHLNVLPSGKPYSDFIYLKNEDIINSKSRGYNNIIAFTEFELNNEPHLLLGTRDYRYLLNDRSFNRQKTIENSLDTSFNAQKSRVEDFYISNKEIWVACLEEGIEIHTINSEGKIIESYFLSENPAFAPLFNNVGSCHAVQADQFGNKWVLYESALFRIKGDVPHLEIERLKGVAKMKMMHLDKEGHLWIVSKGNGLLKLTLNKNGSVCSTQKYTRHNEFPCDYLHSILESANGDLWIASNEGLIQFNPKQESCRLYGKSDGIEGHNFIERSCCLRQNGEMVFGTTNGMYVFHPNEIESMSSEPETVFSGLYVFDRRFEAKDSLFGEKILTENIVHTKHIDIPYKANVLAFEFAGLKVTNPESNTYFYQLEGFDKTWRQTNAKNRKVTYTNLSEGHYTFKVKAMNKEGIVDTSPATIQLTIRPPFVRSIYAYMIYLGLFIVLFYAIRRYYITKQSMKQALEMERFEKEKIEELSQMKMRFFTDVSHEFRTPLSIIKASFDSLSIEKISSNTEKDHVYLANADKNISLLLKLVNQLIDVRRLDQGKMNLEKEITNMVSFVRETVTSFQILAEQKDIVFEIDVPTEKVYAEIDRDQIEKVLYNLLSNAFKYTSSQGKVHVSLAIKTESIEISVQDSGMGIASEHQKAIFTRFYQGNKNNNGNVGSSGIGLSLTKEFVEMHGGTITFTSEKNKGTRFVFQLPAYVGAETNPIKETPIKQQVINHESPNRILESKQTSLCDPQKQTILIVEDNTELRDFLSGRLGETYNIIEAENGAMGIKICKDPNAAHIDLVLSDVMMPVMDGYEMCKQIKSSVETCHIPVILLTAKTMDEHKLEGFNNGADVYIEKPFTYDLLEAQIKSILESKQKIREFFSKQFNKEIDSNNSTETVSDKSNKKTSKTAQQSPKINQYDEQLVEKIKATIRARMHEPEFSVEILAIECAISESTLRRKVKALLGDSPVQLIQHYKIQSAAQLLQNDEYTVYDAMHETGFSNYDHFSKLFKHAYHVSPGEYRKQEREKIIQ